MKKVDGKAEQVVRDFYDKFGWRSDGEQQGEDILFRSFPKAYVAYNKQSEARTIAALNGCSGTLAIVGCGDMPDSHLRIAEQFESVVCIDISKVALELARRKLGARATYIHGSIVDLALSEGSVDAVYCAHVLYHIGEHDQSKAVRAMINLTKVGGQTVLLYANPRSPFSLPGELWRSFRRRRNKRTGEAGPQLYYHAHPLGWWNRFRDACDLKMAPWEIVGSRVARTLLKHESLARAFYWAAGVLERGFPALAVRLWQYPIVVLRRRS